MSAVDLFSHYGPSLIGYVNEKQIKNPPSDAFYCAKVNFLESLKGGYGIN